MYRRLPQHNHDPKPYVGEVPNLVNPKMGGYVGNEREYDRLVAARNIDPDCALESCSVGSYQIMGFHWKLLGHTSVEDYYESMQLSEAAHLGAFCRFIQADSRLLKALRENNWASFARIYNGPAYAKHGYDRRMAKAYVKFNMDLQK
jgi:hypothetical protein